jgi:hypothetical protein
MFRLNGQFFSPLLGLLLYTWLGQGQISAAKRAVASRASGVWQSLVEVSTAAEVLRNRGKQASL